MTMMKCGHAANAIDGNRDPVCAICLGIHSGATETAVEPDLTGRVARCMECGKITISSTNLPFFEHRPDRPYDSYYNGCKGWE